jgi:AraC-like DNA-binding protein
MTSLRNEVQSCRQTLGSVGEALDRALTKVHRPDSKLAKLEDALLNTLAAAERPKLLSRPVALEILKARGVIRISELAQNHRIQARRLERVFLDEIGVTAKVFCRIVRFNHAKSTIETNPDIDLPKLAYECGYADQPHFTRNFREMFGITPADFKARMKEAVKRFREQKPNVVFLQDEAPQPS